MSKKRADPIKVIFIHIMRDTFSGAQKNIYLLLKGIDKEDIYPILLGQDHCPLTEKISKEGIEIKIIPFPDGLAVFDEKILKFNLSRIFKFIKGIWKYNKKLIEEWKLIKPEIIWCDNIRTFITVYVACKVVKTKVILNTWSESGGKIAWIVYRIGLLLADQINIQYPNQGEKLFGKLANQPMFKRKIMPLYTGVSDFEELLETNIREELSLPSSTILIIMAANIVYGKGQKDLIKAVEKLKIEFSNFHLLIAGMPVNSSPESIKYHEEIKGYVLERNLSSFIHFIGWRYDIRDILESSDIYVSTSYSESLPLNVRDAMLASLPVIATDVGGTSELIDINENGYLFKPGDIQALTDYLRALIDNSSLRKTMGLKSKKIIETDARFSSEIYVRDFENMLKELVSNRV